MTETALALHNLQVPDVMTLGKVLAQSGYFTDAREAAQAVVKVLAGAELGFGPVTSMTGIYIVKGKVSLSANLIAAAIKRSGRYNYKVKALTDEGCVIAFYEGKEILGESTFTMADAKKAQLDGGDNWRKFPRNMVFARALSNGAKWFCPDVFGGPVYTPDELGQAVDGETGEIIDVTPTPITKPPAPIPNPAHKNELDEALGREPAPVTNGKCAICHANGAHHAPWCAEIDGVRVDTRKAAKHEE